MQHLTPTEVRAILMSEPSVKPASFEQDYWASRGVRAEVAAIGSANVGERLDGTREPRNSRAARLGWRIVNSKDES